MIITIKHLMDMNISKENAEKYVDGLNDGCERFEINTLARVQAFIPQICEESGLFTRNKESLSYSAQRMMVVWPSRFPTLESTKGCVFNPNGLAEKTYAGRGGNGIGNGDALKYCGRGLIQITFKNTYIECGKALGLDLLNHPELLEQPKWAIESACWFWHKAGCNQVADGDSLDAVKRVTKIINGGYGNLEIRQKYWQKAKKVFGNEILEDKYVSQELINALGNIKQVTGETILFIPGQPNKISTNANPAIVAGQTNIISNKPYIEDKNNLPTINTPVVAPIPQKKDNVFSLVLSGLISMFKKKG